MSISAACPFRMLGGLSVQDPFSEGNDPAFHNKRGPGPGGGPYQRGGGPTDPTMRMQYEASKDPYGGQRKGEEGNRLQQSKNSLWGVLLHRGQ